MGIVSKLYTTIALLSPRIEVRLRQLYWKNNKRLGRYNPNVARVVGEQEKEPVDFDEILEHLKNCGVKDGSLLIVHSSYDSLASTGLSPLDIINKLKNLVGETGTLAMPVIRTYKEDPQGADKITFNFSRIHCVYNPRRTPVITGILPSTLMRMPGAEISLHPLNPMCAWGPLAKEMMEHNIEGSKPSPHGKDSSWRFCLDHNALVCSLGTDLRHHNTMTHVAEESFGDWYWSDDEWFNERSFTIETKGNPDKEIVVRERKPKWGMLHQAELNRYHDLLSNDIIKSKKIKSVLVEFEESQKLIKYLRSKNKKGYPYFK